MLVKGATGPYVSCIDYYAPSAIYLSYRAMYGLWKDGDVSKIANSA